GIDDWLHGQVIRRERAVDCGVRLTRSGLAHFAGHRPAGAAELTHDLGGRVDDGRAAAPAVDGAVNVPTVDPVAARPAAARPDGRIDIVLRIDLRPEVRVADPVDVRAVGVRDGRAVPPENDRTGWRIGVQVQQTEVTLLSGRRHGRSARLERPAGVVGTVAVAGRGREPPV